MTVRARYLGVMLVAVMAARVDAQVISIAEARSLPAGTVVTVEGSVTVPSGRFASSTFDQGFALQDDTGGIYVSTAASSNLNYHRRVRVTGEVGDDGFGLMVLRPASLADVKKLPGAHAIEPTPLATGDVSEATEGLLVRISGRLSRPIVNDLPFGYQVFVDDGSGETQIFVAASTGINPFNIPFLVKGDEITAVGYSGQFLGQYEVLPRHRGDIRRAH
ncbi:MAG TPA: DNA-binding protein [Thermoanaerobaculia bacterium]|nr:DNA-binding protein [Thermoanaerobaculia bacterium]